MDKKLISIAEALKNLSVDELNEVKGELTSTKDLKITTDKAKQLHKKVVEYIVKNMEHSQIQDEEEDSNIDKERNTILEDGDVPFTLSTKIGFANKSHKIIVVTSVEYTLQYKSFRVNGLIFVQQKGGFKSANKSDLYDVVYDEQSFEQNKEEWVGKLKRICK
jgi:hypothetical protein